MLRFAYGLDRLRVVAGSRLVRFAAALLALGLIAYSTFQWQKTGRLAELAPNFLAAFIALILASARREP
jgi:hypothetical protein